MPEFQESSRAFFRIYTMNCFLMQWHQEPSSTNNCFLVQLHQEPRSINQFQGVSRAFQHKFLKQHKHKHPTHGFCMYVCVSFHTSVDHEFVFHLCAVWDLCCWCWCGCWSWGGCWRGSSYGGSNVYITSSECTTILHHVSSCFHSEQR